MLIATLGGVFTNSKQAFTLIELLAIIVILAIIAVITVPIILSVIDNAKKGSIIDSAYGYKDAIKQYYLERLSKDTSFKLDDNYYLVNSDGSIVSSNYRYLYDIELSGTKPKGGYFEYEDNKITNGCLTVDDYKVTIENGEIKDAEKGVCIDMSPTSCQVESSPESWFVFGDNSNAGRITALQPKDETHPDGYDGEDTIKIPCDREDGTKITHIGWNSFSDMQLKEFVVSDSVEEIDNAPLERVKIEKVIFGKSIKEVGGRTLHDSTLGNVIFTNTPEKIRDAAFQNSTIDELVLGGSINAFTCYHIYILKNISSIKTIYNSENKVLDWNYLLKGESATPFSSGIVNKNGNDIIIKSDISI